MEPRKIHASHPIRCHSQLCRPRAQAAKVDPSWKVLKVGSVGGRRPSWGENLESMKNKTNLENQSEGEPAVATMSTQRHNFPWPV